MIITETPRRQLVSKLVAWGHWFTSANIVIAIAISGVYLFSSRIPDTGLGLAYLFSNWFSHVGFLTFIAFIIFILPICYLVPNSRFLRGYGSFAAASALALLALDALLYTRYGLHLSFQSAEFIRSHANIAVAELSTRQWGFFILSFIGWLLLQLVIANALWKRIERLQKLKWGLPIGAAFTGMFVFSHATHIWADAELYHPVIQQDDMFPLSYPATAKTLMSKYGLLSIESYEQKKQLALNLNKRDVAYPTEPLYCVVDTQRKVALWFLSEGDALPEIDKRLNLLPLNQHFDLSLNQQGAVKSILYGLPDLYHWQLRNHLPIMADLPNKLGLPVHLYAENPALIDNIKGQKTETWESYFNAFQTQSSGLFIGFIGPDELEQLQKVSHSSNHIFISQLNANSAVSAFSNFDIHDSYTLSHHEDIAATTLYELGCNVKDSLHSTGQKLQGANRHWLVTSQNDKVLILYQQLKIEVDSSGNFYIYNLDGSPNNAAELNTGLLSQAIKLLSRFSESE
ncbi:DUF3413 domain-containing protein [Alteromonas sp. a30]|uniref:DUF3413 domain-containing protein n=1 Tax=Alteromonas sp. a30 TaxID=2730917 RepID=UPI00227FF16D|nr:DUF3413 domain-containing protein [Alteromonas sp. a30]MCY7294156.1 DUF3413 domain-containing protein [Alteromonas sp. a30]